MRKLATGTPAPVVRGLGSSTTLPTMVMYVSFMCPAPCSDPVSVSGSPAVGVESLKRRTGVRDGAQDDLWMRLPVVDGAGRNCRRGVVTGQPRNVRRYAACEV